MSEMPKLKTCPDCGMKYSSKEAIEVNYGYQTVKACPHCGYTNIKR